jgi:hypothetical protein
LLSALCHPKRNDKRVVVMDGTRLFFFGVTLESLPFFGVSVDYFAVFKRFFSLLCSFHFGVPLEFSRWFIKLDRGEAVEKKQVR